MSVSFFTISIYGQSTQHICIDASALTNNSVASLDMKRFASDQFSQVVFRRSGLSRERAPPKAPQEHYWRPYQSEESVLSCPPFSSDSPAPLTEEGDCQYSPTVSRST
ncbi:unnamed protein product [Protopolystoma xenopodis]|uniref:Uncharacterized protein n=1 Tax=Protopolystoma xenopodis TaxID=117903 RepID=A0A3S5BNF0_9PLAT|nr:unnamed protein product [Protopolystoma xenopodis]